MTLTFDQATCFFCSDTFSYDNHFVPNYFQLLPCMTTGVIPKALPVLSTEPVLRKIAVDREIRFSTEQYECRQKNDSVKYVARVLF